MSVGPAPDTARLLASAVASYIATGSVPSTDTPGKPKAWDFSAKFFARVCNETGVEMAQPLLTRTKITGASSTPAKLAASSKSPSELLPSPKKTSTQPGSCWIFIPHARPTACGIWVARLIWGGQTFTGSGMCPPSGWPSR